MATRTRRLDVQIGSEAKGDGFKQTEKDADALGDKLKNTGDRGGKGLVDGVEKATDKLGTKLKAASDKASSSFASGMAGAGSAASDALSSGFDVGSIADSLSGAISGLGGSLGPVGAAAGLAIGGALTVGFIQGLDIEKAGDKVAAQLDLTAQESERLGGIAGGLYADGYGDSIEDVNTALGAVISSVGDIGTFTDAELRKAGAMALDFAGIWDTDVTDAVGDVGILVKTGLAKDVTEAFDLMTAGMQQTPAAFREELIPAVEEYSGFLDGLGFTGAEMFGLMTQQAEKFGTYGIDKAMDALKEFGIKATDTSTATADAFKTIGLDAGLMQGKLLEGGTVGKEAFDAIVEGLLGIEDPFTRANTAIALFGAPIEDLSVQKIPEFLESFANAEGSLGDFAGAASEAGDTFNDNFATRLESIKRTVLQKLVGFVDDKVIPAFNAMSDWAKENPGAFQALAISVGLLAVGFTALGIAAGIATIGLIGVTLPMFLISLAILGLILLIGLLVIHWDTVKEAAGAAWDWIKDKAMGAFNWVKENWPLILAILTGPIGLAVLAITKNWDSIKAGATGVKNWIVDRFNDVVGFVKDLPGAIADAASGMWDGIKNSFKTAVNAIIGWWNDLGFTLGPLTIGRISIAGREVFGGATIGPYTLGTPNITPLAEGGIATSPTLAMIGEGRHDEAVFPLPPDWRTNGLGGGDTYITEIHVHGSLIHERDLDERIVQGVSRVGAKRPILSAGRRIT